MQIAITGLHRFSLQILIFMYTTCKYYCALHILNLQMNLLPTEEVLQCVCVVHAQKKAFLHDYQLNQ